MDATNASVFRWRPWRQWRAWRWEWTVASQGFKRGRPSFGLVRVHATLHGFAEKERQLELPEGARADDAPRAVGIRPELVLVFRDDEPIPSDEPLRDGDRLRIVRVVSGG